MNGEKGLDKLGNVEMAGGGGSTVAEGKMEDSHGDRFSGVGDEIQYSGCGEMEMTTRSLHGGSLVLGRGGDEIGG
ncbi:unnamed protein product [Arabis nemorensis]|uniref:Uncharacterized protein n=1 Tax=Arabis nemorensis TaxID=586526 RepID=A0A565CDI0_9BRAS|nr:unnamed protein product [Arabis nemorensis]